MKNIRHILLAISLLFFAMSCGNNPQPEDGKEYVKIEKGLLLPVPDENDSTKFDYTKIEVNFESDGVYVRSKELLSNAMMSVNFKTPQYKTIFGAKEFNTKIGLNFKDLIDEAYIYFADYSDFRKYTPYWTWDDVESVRFVYHPQTYDPVFISLSDYETYEEYEKALQDVGFEYEVTIYRNSDIDILNDPDFDSVFKLFRAHTTK